MFKMGDSFDDYDFTPSANSNLSNLFADSPVEVSHDNKSLTYTAPKQPRPATQNELKSESTKGNSTVICAIVVSLWKLSDSKYNSVGKHGLAIIGSSTQNAYEMILYKEQRNVIVRAKICDTFELILKKDNFASFYDYTNVNWLIKFATGGDASKITNEIEKYGGKVVPIASTEKITAEEIRSTSNVEDNDATSENRAKADILSRIVKMGHSILPNHSNTSPKTTDSVSDSDTDSIKTIETLPSNITQTESIIPQRYVQLPTPQPVQNIPANTYIASQITPFDPLSMFFAENRTHNSEVRMNLSQISDKLNQVLNLVNTAPKSGNCVEEESAVLKNKVKALELRIENLSSELSNYQAKYARLQTQLDEQRSVKQDAEELKAQLEDLREQGLVDSIQSEQEIQKYKDRLNDLNELVVTLKAKISSFEDNEKANSVVQDVGFSEEQSEKMQKLFSEKVKSTMNELYAKIVEQCSQNTDTQVNSIVGSVIKTATLKIIRDFQEVYKCEIETLTADV